MLAKIESAKKSGHYLRPRHEAAPQRPHAFSVQCCGVGVPFFGATPLSIGASSYKGGLLERKPILNCDGYFISSRMYHAAAEPTGVIAGAVGSANRAY